MEQTEYLYNNYREPTPDWLMAIDGDSEIPWKQFFESRTVFYPGAGMDPHTVEVFGGAHCAHCFINVDYLDMKTGVEFKTRERTFSEKDLERDETIRQAHKYYDLSKPLFPGYTLVFSRSLSEGEFFAMFDNPYSYRRDPDLQRFRARSDFDNYGHFVKFYVFERNADCTNPRAVERFALLYLGADAFPVFNAVYAQGRVNLFAAIIEDYGFGCQYERFGNRELLHEMAKKANVFPEFIMSRDRYGVWKNYAAVDDVEESMCERTRRSLYKIDKEAFRVEAGFKKYQHRDFSQDFAKWFSVKRRADEKGVNFVDGDFACFVQKQEVRCRNRHWYLQGFYFSAACFFNFLIPQIIGELGGESAYYDYARATGWPVMEYKKPFDLSSAQVLFKVDLIPGEYDIAYFCRVLEVLKEYFADDIYEFFHGSLNTLNSAAYTRLCENWELSRCSVMKLLNSRTDEFVQSLKPLYR